MRKNSKSIVRCRWRITTDYQKSRQEATCYPGAIVSQAIQHFLTTPGHGNITHQNYEALFHAHSAKVHAVVISVELSKPVATLFLVTNVSVDNSYRTFIFACTVSQHDKHSTNF